MSKEKYVAVAEYFIVLSMLGLIVAHVFALFDTTINVFSALIAFILVLNTISTALIIKAVQK